MKHCMLPLLLLLLMIVYNANSEIVISKQFTLRYINDKRKER